MVIEFPALTIIRTPSYDAPAAPLWWELTDFCIFRDNIASLLLLIHVTLNYLKPVSPRIIFHPLYQCMTLPQLHQSYPIFIMISRQNEQLIRGSLLLHPLIGFSSPLVKPRPHYKLPLSLFIISASTVRAKSGEFLSDSLIREVYSLFKYCVYDI